MRGKALSPRMAAAAGGVLVIAGTLVAGTSFTAAQMTPPQAAVRQNSAGRVAPTTPADTHAKASADTLSRAFRHAAELVIPSVVTIETRPKLVRWREEQPPRAARPNFGRSDNPFAGTPFEDFFNNPAFRRQFRIIPNSTAGGLGSGVIIDPSGIILTNNHVVAGGGEVTVRLSDGREFEAVDVKTDPKTDLAVVRIEGAENLVAARLGDSDQIAIGDWVLALGQPFGLESTVTAGIISAKHRAMGITARENFLQTDAAINPGNSGGPLVNLDGEVIGINTAISTRSGGNQGIGFAVPVNLAKWVSRQLIDRGVVRRAYLGVGIQSVTPQLAKRFDVPPRHGVVITQVGPDTPAARAGLQPGDVLVKFNGRQVASPEELQVMVEGARIGAEHPLTVVRDGREIQLTMIAEEQPGKYTAADLAPRQERSEPLAQPEPRREASLGVELETLTPRLAARLGMPQTHGVVITAVHAGSLAEQRGLEPGMVIEQINRKPVASVEQARRQLDGASLEQGVLLLIVTPEGSRFVVVKS